ncbi:MAG: tripartite tricarboxylate transporter substrate-binding protein, partial [Alphaproteobacteria bacterium]|nr:tripartite tricarboxylate transporter substrate-binding protein [Alphaproteobacteria bacterium]
MRQKLLAALLAFGCLCGFTITASAQSADTNWPTRPITMVVAYPPGAITDTVGRRVAERLSQALNVQVVVENRPGAGGNVA